MRRPACSRWYALTWSPELCSERLSSPLLDSQILTGIGELVEHLGLSTPIALIERRGMCVGEAYGRLPSSGDFRFSTECGYCPPCERLLAQFPASPISQRTDRDSWVGRARELRLLFTCHQLVSTSCNGARHMKRVSSSQPVTHTYS